jgi:sulfide:quinone oxidoreductase
MTPRTLDERLSVLPQTRPEDLPALAAMGFRSIINNRPDGEAADQPPADEIAAAARAAGLQFANLPVVGGAITVAQIEHFGQLLETLPGPILAYCRTGTRSSTLWALSQARQRPVTQLLQLAADAGYDLSAQATRMAGIAQQDRAGEQTFDVVIIGAGSGGLAVATSLLRRQSSLRICLLEPRQQHYYQPGWTMVGAGVFNAAQTMRQMANLIPPCIDWKQTAAAAIDADNNRVQLCGGDSVRYRALVVATGLELDWDAIPGLRDALGRDGVTSNYRYDLAPYTWELAQQLRGGNALFTQPPMPIKCAGAPQKAMYLSADHWLRQGALSTIDIAFHSAAPTLFGVAEYIPALMEYIQRYAIELNFGSTLIAVDGPAKLATFATHNADGVRSASTRSFDMLHVAPPQRAPQLIIDSKLGNATGWLDVDPASLRHSTHANIFGVGDVVGTSNAKTAAAARKHAPVVAENVLATLAGAPLTAVYDGYGSCPLTVERGKIVLAEFGYGGKLMPTFPSWLIDGRRPSRLAWHLKADTLPNLYWNAMLKGREWLCAPGRVSAGTS